MSDTIVARVYKYDPSVDEAPHYEEYEVPWKEYMTALEVFHYINENLEPLEFDYCCRSGLCGRDSVTVDGVPCLACFHTLDAGKHTFEPLAGFPVIRDLIVDRESVMKVLTDTKLAVQSVDPVSIYTLAEIPYETYWEDLERLNMCRECMCCYSVCPVVNGGKTATQYAGPAAFAQIALRHLDPAEQGDRVSQAAFAGIFSCIECGSCETVCASGIEHVKFHKILKDAAEAQGLKPSA